MSLDTRKLPDRHPLAEAQELGQSARHDAAPDDIPAFLRFHIAETNHAITVSVRQVITIGRHDPAQGIRPDVDLAPYRGYHFGVSRRHALILRQKNTLYVRSLNTTNGTSLNNQPLMPGLEYPLRNGDDLLIGMLNLHVELIPVQAGV